MQLLKRTRLAAPALVALLIAGGSATHAYTISGHAGCIGTLSPLGGGMVKVYEVDPVPGGSYSASLFMTATTDLEGNFSATGTWPTPGPGFESGGPDLVFEVDQVVGASVEVVYQEVSSDVRWNVADGSWVGLEITSPLAICVHTSEEPPNTDLFVFNRIGVAEIGEIDCKGNDGSSEGYWRPRKDGFAASDSDQPFGRTLDLFAWVGQAATIDYYKLQHCFDEMDDCNVEASWTDVETPLPNKWYDTSDPDSLNWHWVPQSMGPTSVDGIDNLYQIPYRVRPNTPWSWLDRIGRFDTTVVPDGLNRLRIVPYKKTPDGLKPAGVSDLKIDGNYGEIVLQVDNTPPIVQILDVKLNGVSKEACDVLTLGTGAGDKVTVDYRVRDPRGHLRDYSLQAMYGHDCHVKPLPDKAAGDYATNATASPLWLGELSYTTDYLGATYAASAPCPEGGGSPCIDCSSGDDPEDQMPTCAYQFRLQASKRTTNGYGLIYHHVEDTWHVTIQR